MSVKSMKIASMIEMLPENEKDFALEFVKRLILAWDPDYTKLTAFERKLLDEAEDGEYIDDEDIDWDNLAQYAE